MQSVSRGWKDNHKQTLLPESYVEIELSLGDPDALADAGASDNGAASISKTSQIVSEVDKEIIPYVTLEQNLWVLDGEMQIIPTSNSGDCGYIGSSLSKADCTFTSTPIVTISFTKVHASVIPGITIMWGTEYEDYPTDFTVTAYNGSTVVASSRVTDNDSIRSVVLLDIANYNRITISINKWCLPYRRPRIEEIFAGVEKIYSKSDLYSFSHSQEVDPISSALPKSTISFSLDNTDNSYNPNNASGLSKYLIERQEIKARYGYKVGDDVEWIACGTFYMSEWEAKQNSRSAEFTARDLLEFMTDIYPKGVYNANGTSLYDLALDVLSFSNLPLQNDGGVKWYIDEALKNIYTVAPLPVDTVANCLQLIANAGQCVMYQDREGVLHIERFTPTSVDGEYAITSDNSYSKPEITLSKPVKQIVVPVYSYSAGDKIELYNGYYTINGTSDVLINYSEPATNVEALVTTGGTINSVEYYANSCKVNVTATGKFRLKVTGNKLVSSSADVVINVQPTGDAVRVDNPLITDDERAAIIANLVKEYTDARQSLSLSWRPDPRLDALDVIKSQNEFVTNDMIMTKVQYTYNGAFRGKGTGKVI